VISLIPLTIESLVAILLLLTILYCVRLNGQLKRLKSDGSSMQATIVELVNAVDAAERAIAGLRATVREADETLGAGLQAAERINAELRSSTAAGADVLHRLTPVLDVRPWLLGAQAADESQPATEPRSMSSDLPAIAAAAQALAERARARMRSKAAAA
jgi:hypothetical protein